MKEINIFVTNSKIHAPFLLACSFNGYISFIRSFTQNDIVYWEFTPYEKAHELIDKFEVKVDPNVPLKDIFAAQDVFWRKVYEAKNN